MKSVLPSADQSSGTDALLDEIAACLARVREHVYGNRVGALIVETASPLLELGGERGPTADQTFWPVVVRPEDGE